MDEYRRLVLSFSGDPDRNVLLTALGALGAATNTATIKPMKAGPEFILQIASTIGELNRSTRNNAAENRIVLEFAATWFDYIADASHRGDNKNQIDRRSTATSGRHLLDLASANLRSWNDGEASNGIGFSSLSLVTQIATICSSYQIPISFSPSAASIRSCIDHRTSDATGRVIYGCFRALVSLATHVPEFDPGAGADKVINELLATLETLAQVHSRPPIPVWTLREVANLACDVFRQASPRIQRSLVVKLANLQGQELLAIADHLANQSGDNQSTGSKILLKLFLRLVKLKLHNKIAAVGVLVILEQLRESKTTAALSYFELIANNFQQTEPWTLESLSYAARKLSSALYLEDQIYE